MFLALLVVATPAMAQECGPDQELEQVPVQAEPGKRTFQLRCVQKAPASSYPDPKALPVPGSSNPERLQGGARSTVAGNKTGHQDIATRDGQSETVFVTVPNSASNGKRITGPAKAIEGPPFHLNGLRHGK
jgi:hypothetical protein